MINYELKLFFNIYQPLDRSELSSTYLDQANSFLPGPGTRLLTVGVSTSTVLKSPRGLTVPAFSPARWGLRVPRRVRPRTWPRSPLPGSTPCLSKGPIVCERRAPRPHGAARRSEGASRITRSGGPGSAQPRPAPPTQIPAAQRARSRSPTLGPGDPSRQRAQCVRRFASQGPAEGLWPQTRC